MAFVQFLYTLLIYVFSKDQGWHNITTKKMILSFVECSGLYFFAAVVYLQEEETNSTNTTSCSITIFTRQDTAKQQSVLTLTEVAITFSFFFGSTAIDDLYLVNVNVIWWDFCSV